MRFILRNAIALTALVFAMTGTGIAASRCAITSISQIAPSAGMAPLYDLPAGDGLWLVRILRDDALDDECEPMPIKLPLPATMDAKP